MNTYRVSQFLPHGGAVKMHHHPFGRVESYRVREVDSRQPFPELGAYESCAGVGGVHVEPKLLFLANGAKFLKVVEGTASCGAQGGAQL